VLARVDMNRLMATVDVKALVQQVDVNEMAQQVDVDGIIRKVDVDAVVDRVDLNEVVQRIDVDELVEKTDLGSIIARSSSGFASDLLDVIRGKTVAVDDFIARAVARLRRRPYTRPPGPVGRPRPDVPPPDQLQPAGLAPDELKATTES
jgi:hypothetical protein